MLTTAAGRIITQYRGKPKIAAYILVLVEQCRILYEQLEAIPAAFCLSDAVGWRLDWLGALVGQRRVGTTDAIYRLWIQARILVNRSTGKAEDMRLVADLLIPGSTYSEFAETVVFDCPTDLTREVALSVVTLLQQAAPAGARVFLQYGDMAPAFKFATTGQATYQPDLAGGWDDSAMGNPLAGLWCGCVCAADGE
jgi:hypothetical protein